MYLSLPLDTLKDGLSRNVDFPGTWWEPEQEGGQDLPLYLFLKTSASSPECAHQGPLAHSHISSPKMEISLWIVSKRPRKWRKAGKSYPQILELFSKKTVMKFNYTMHPVSLYFIALTKWRGSEIQTWKCVNSADRMKVRGCFWNN